MKKFQVKHSFQDFIIDVTSWETGEVKKEDKKILKPYSNFILSNGTNDFFTNNGKPLFKEIESQNNHYPWGIYFDKSKLINYIKQKYSKLKKDSKSNYIDLSELYKVISHLDRREMFATFSLSKTLNIPIENFNGKKVYKTSQLKFSHVGVKKFCENVGNSLAFYLEKEKGIAVKNVNFRSIKGICDFTENNIKIVHTLCSKDVVVEILRKWEKESYSFDNKGLRKETITTLIKNIKEDSDFFFLKDILKKYK